MSAPNENEIDIGAMPLDQLNGLKQQLETEIGRLTNNFANLKEAQVRLLDSKQAQFTSYVAQYVLNSCPQSSHT
jgi:hypothetical protein